jgi:hypothetical protein
MSRKVSAVIAQKFLWGNSGQRPEDNETRPPPSTGGGFVLDEIKVRET